MGPGGTSDVSGSRVSYLHLSTGQIARLTLLFQYSRALSRSLSILSGLPSRGDIEGCGAAQRRGSTIRPAVLPGLQQRAATFPTRA